MRQMAGSPFMAKRGARNTRFMLLYPVFGFPRRAGRHRIARLQSNTKRKGPRATMHGAL